MSKRRNTHKYGATEEQVVRSIDTKRALLKVIGNRTMQCAHCAQGHLLVSQNSRLFVLNPCDALSRQSR